MHEIGGHGGCGVTRFALLRAFLLLLGAIPQQSHSWKFNFGQIYLRRPSHSPLASMETIPLDQGHRPRSVVRAQAILWKKLHQ